MTSMPAVVHLGFTGSRCGLSIAQSDRLVRVFARFSTYHVIFHHGDCTGAETQACKLAVDAGFSLHSHPSKIEKFRAYIPSAVVEEPRDPLVRNRAIVRVVKLLVACPEGFEETRRSGTWATIRYARTAKCPRLVVWPDGKVQHERE